MVHKTPAAHMTTSFDVAIVGGGAVGLCTAWYLQKAGISSLVVERNQPGSGCSLRNAGLIVPSHFVPLANPGIIAQGLRWMLHPSSPFHVKPRFDPALFWWLWKFWRASTDAHVNRSMPLLRDLAQASFGLFEGLAAEGLEFEFMKNGLLMLFRSERGRAGCLEEAALAEKIGVPARVVDQEGVCHLDPNTRYAVLGGVQFPEDGQLHPSAFGQAMAAAAEQAGAVIRSHTEISGFAARDNAIVAAQTSSGEISARVFVLASGAWSPAILRDLRLRMPLQPGKGYSLTIPRPAPCPRMPLMLTEARVAVTPFATSLRAAGTMELAGLDLSLNERRLTAIRRAVPEYLPDFNQQWATNAEAWSGLRPCTPDGLPYVGRFRQWPNLIAATGHAMLGITLAPITGQLVADLIAERRPSIDIAALAPDRFD
jgi:D-amino-acid dehydrogenase